jgi:hypothetical protein
MRGESTKDLGSASPWNNLGVAQNGADVLYSCQWSTFPSH